MSHRFIAFFTCLFLLPLATLANEPLFPKEVTINDSTFEQLGEYRYIYRIFFPLYEAALYTAPGADAADVLEASEPFHLTFRYLREIDKSIILKSADRMLEKNLSPEERDQIADRVARINEAYITVTEGDRSSLTFVPNEGTTLRVNGEARVTIPGDDFAQLYFRIWIGPEALSASLREHLLGRQS